MKFKTLYIRGIVMLLLCNGSYYGISQNSFVDAHELATIDPANPLEFNAGTLTDMINSQIPEEGGVLWIKKGTWEINMDLTIPENVELRIAKGVTLNILTDQSLFIRGNLNAGPYRIFAFDELDSPNDDLDAGKVRWIYPQIGSSQNTKYRTPTLLPEWWGALGDGESNDYIALQRCLNVPNIKDYGGKIVFQPAKEYVIYKGLTANNSERGTRTLWLEGNYSSIVLRDDPLAPNDAVSAALQIGDVENSVVHWKTKIIDLKIDNQKVPAPSDNLIPRTVGIKIVNGDQGIIRNCEVLNFRHGIESSGNDNNLWTLEDVWLSGNIINLKNVAGNLWTIIGGKHETSFRSIDFEGKNAIFQNINIANNGGYHLFDEETYSRLTDFLTSGEQANLRAEIDVQLIKQSTLLDEYLVQLGFSTLDNQGNPTHSEEAFAIKKISYERFLELFNQSFSSHETENSIIRLINSERFTFSNFFEKMGVSMPGDKSRLLTLLNCDQFTLSNNRFVGNIDPSWSAGTHMGYGVYLQNSSNGIIQGNSFINFQISDIIADEFSKNNLIDNNNYGTNGAIQNSFTSSSTYGGLINEKSLGIINRQKSHYTPQNILNLENYCPSIDPEFFDLWENTSVTLDRRTVVAPNGIDEASVFSFSSETGGDMNIAQFITDIPIQENDYVVLRFWAKFIDFVPTGGDLNIGIPLISTSLRQKTKYPDNSSNPNHVNPTFRGKLFIHAVGGDWKLYEDRIKITRLLEENGELQRDLRLAFNVFSSHDQVNIALWGPQVLLENETERNFYYPYSIPEKRIEIKSKLNQYPITVAQKGNFYRQFYAKNSPDLLTPLDLGNFATATWRIGDKAWNSEPAPGEFEGWVFTAEGWVGFGMISEPTSTSPPAAPQNIWETIGQIPVSNVQGASFVNNQIIFAFNLNGKVFKSPDRGRNWFNKDKGIISNLGSRYESIFFLDRYIGFLGGGIRNFGGIERPVIFKTTDGGENWERLIRFPVGFGFGQSDRIKEIQFFNSRKGIVLTTRGLFQTDDGGSNWTNISERLPNNSGGILMEFVNNTTGFIFDEQGKLFKTYNQGNSWFEVNSINAPNSEISCISASSFEKLYACAENGYWKSEDNGHIWILNSSNQAKFDAIAFKDDELGFAAISSSSGNVSLFRTQNGGVQWVPEQIPTPINEVVEMTYLQSLKRVVAISRDGTVIGLED